MIAAFVDSSYDIKRNVAGIGIVLDNGIKQRNISNWIPAVSNNYGEMYAIYLAAILLNGRKGVIYTDSQTAIQYIYHTIKDKPRTHEQYIQHKQMELLAYKIRRLNIPVEKTKAHMKSFNKDFVRNNMADLLAKYGRSKFYS